MSGHNHRFLEPVTRSLFSRIRPRAGSVIKDVIKTEKHELLFRKQLIPRVSLEAAAAQPGLRAQNPD